MLKIPPEVGRPYPCLIVDAGGLYIVSTVLTQTGVPYVCVAPIVLAVF